jgi:hypothetical protein
MRGVEALDKHDGPSGMIDELDDGIGGNLWSDGSGHVGAYRVDADDPGQDTV